jgi:hypothetical protein
VVRKAWEFECSILSDTFETESELVRDAEAGATSLYVNGDWQIGTFQRRETVHHTSLSRILSEKQ